jgi:hypothetical protein
MGLGMGLTMTPATAAIGETLPPEKQGVASALNDTSRKIGGALGVALFRGPVRGEATEAAVVETTSVDEIAPLIGHRTSAVPLAGSAPPRTAGACGRRHRAVPSCDRRRVAPAHGRRTRGSPTSRRGRAVDDGQPARKGDRRS